MVFYRGYLESFSNVVKTPRVSINNIKSETESSNEKLDNNQTLKKPANINENNSEIKEESYIEIKNEV